MFAFPPPNFWPRGFLAIVSLLFALACAGILGTPMEQMERGYISRTSDISTLKERAQTDELLVQEVDEALTGFQQQYEALPSEEGRREEELGKLNIAMRSARQRLEEKVEVVEAAVLTVAKAEGAKIRAQFNGSWMAPSISLVIEPSGQVHYENNSTGVSKSIDAPMQSFTAQSFSVGVLGFVTTFEIDTPPYQDPDGTWRMKLDGIEYTRQ